MTDPKDALSDVLRLVRLRACVYFVKDMVPPWGMDIPMTPNGPLHMVLAGRCLVRHDGREMVLNTGDAVLLPHGAPHAMLDSASTVPEPGPSVMKRLIGDPGGNLAGTAVPEATRMLCGHFEWDGALDHPLFRELPELIVVRAGTDPAAGASLRKVVDLIAAESAGDAPGGAAIADRMGEVLFVSLLRAWMVARAPSTGVLATIGDARLSRALSFMHRNPGEDLTLGRLAQVAGMSRTAFALRFRDAMGITPTSYLTDWRMLQARQLLLRTEVAINEIVERVGYGSDAAFVRAFKRRFGETPARLRRSAGSREPVGVD